MAKLKRFELRLTEGERRKIKKNAQKLGISMNDYIRARLNLPTITGEQIRKNYTIQLILIFSDIRQILQEIQETGKISPEAAQKLNAYYRTMRKLAEEIQQ